ncbi:hypothetical protein KIPB_014967, partial [Kipferlia bialata]
WFWVIFGLLAVIVVIAFVAVMSEEPEDNDLVILRTILSMAIQICCAGDTLLLGWEHMIAAGAWDWGWLI